MDDGLVGAKSLRISLVTAFPPGRGDLNEYGFHLACALKDSPSVELTVLADDLDNFEELAGFNVKRCWRFNSLFSLPRLIRTIKSTEPNVVWFNIGFSTFASNPGLAFLSITLPLLTRMLGFCTHVTLHTVFERISLTDAGIRHAGLYRLAGRVATRLLLWSGDVTVLMPSFRSELIKSYKVNPDRVQFRPHGTFAATQSSAALRTITPEHSILAFGYWGTYKKLDILFKAMEEVLHHFPDAVLEVGGTDHPNNPGYLESLQARYSDSPSMRFLGYVAEDDLAALFGRARVLVLPYSSAAGTSGVVHQACQFGLPLVASEIAEFAEIAEEESLAISFYPHGDAKALARHLMDYLESDELCERSSRQNLAASQSTPLAGVVESYIEQFRRRIRARHREAKARANATSGGHRL